MDIIIIYTLLMLKLIQKCWTEDLREDLIQFPFQVHETDEGTVYGCMIHESPATQSPKIHLLQINFSYFKDSVEV